MIFNCFNFKRWYREGRRVDWHKIDHIPNIYLGDNYVRRGPWGIFSYNCQKLGGKFSLFSLLLYICNPIRRNKSSNCLTVLYNLEAQVYALNWMFVLTLEDFISLMWYLKYKQGIYVSCVCHWLEIATQTNLKLNS